MNQEFDEKKATQAKESETYKKARNKAEQYAKEPEKLHDLLAKATTKANGKKGSLSGVWQKLTVCFRLIKAYANGSYRKIPWSSLALLITTILYFLSPIDVIPDFIIALGLLDDVALISWTFKAIAKDIAEFEEWEKDQQIPKE